MLRETKGWRENLGDLLSGCTYPAGHEATVRLYWVRLLALAGDLCWDEISSLGSRE